MSVVRIGVLGAGLIGKKHIAVLLANKGNYELVGVADPDLDAAKRAAPEAQHFSSVQALLAQAKPDGVVISTPNQTHLEIGLTCIKAGLPILVEKPVADSLEDAHRLIDAAEAADVPILVGHHRRHNPIMQAAARAVHEGSLGRIVSASSLWMTHKPKGYHDPAWRRRPGGGPILINAIHEVDSLRMLLGNIAEVQAFSSNAVRGFEVEDTTAAVFRFSSGALGTLTLSDTASAPWTWEWTSGENPDFPKTNADSLFIAGTLGSLAVPSLCLRTHLKGAESWLTPLLEDKLPYQAQDPYIPQMTNFADVIRGDAEPVVSGREGLKTLAATLAIAEAANTGRAVKL